MAPLAGHLVGYLSMFLQLGVLVLLAGLAMLVRGSLGRRLLDGWVGGLVALAAALAVLSAAALGRDFGRFHGASVATILYALLENVGALAFIVTLRRARGARPLSGDIAALFAFACGVTTAAALCAPPFLDTYRVHSAFLAALLTAAAFESLRAQRPGIGSRLITAALSALALDYAHVPLLSLLGVHFPSSYLGLESYLTVVLDIVLGVAIVVHATDGVRSELEQRNAALAHAEAALRDAAFTDALCAIPNRAAFLQRIADPPAFGVVTMIDLDGLKAINDRFGHAAGDASLQMTARCLRACAGDAAMIYRIGGDEFAGVWPGMDALRVRAKLTAAERELAVFAQDLPAPVSMSWGIAPFDAQTPFAEAMIAADNHLYDRRNVRRA
jgi:diguanylate cyclase (GGDEF)-like protein